MDVLPKSLPGALRQTRLPSSTPESFLKALSRFLHNSNPLRLYTSQNIALPASQTMAVQTQTAIRTILLIPGACRKSAERQASENLHQAKTPCRYISTKKSPPSQTLSGNYPPQQSLLHMKAYCSFVFRHFTPVSMKHIPCFSGDSGVDFCGDVFAFGVLANCLRRWRRGY